MDRKTAYVVLNEKAPYLRGSLLDAWINGFMRDPDPHYDELSEKEIFRQRGAAEREKYDAENKPEKKLLIEIDGEVLEVESVNNYDPTYLDLSDGTEWIIFETQEAAGEAAREYWEDMTQNDPREFTCMVGKETLVSWALGQYAGPGYTQVKSLEEWLDLWLDTPEEHFAGYDGEEHDCRINNHLKDELDFYTKNCVCYRHN